MKKLVAAVVVFLVLAAVLRWMLYNHEISERRSDFLKTKMELMEAHIELCKFGGFTNRNSHMTVYPYTNRVTINDISYQCEFAVESDYFEGRGFLTITTNETFVWIDKEKGVMPLGELRRFPPGF